MWLVLFHFENCCKRPSQVKPFPAFLPDEAGTVCHVLSSDSCSFVAWDPAHAGLLRESCSVYRRPCVEPPVQSLSVKTHKVFLAW